MAEVSAHHSWPKTNLTWRANAPVAYKPAGSWKLNGASPKRRTDDRKPSDILNAETWRKPTTPPAPAADESRPNVSQRKSEPDVSKLVHWRQPAQTTAKEAPAPAKSPATLKDHGVSAQDAKRARCSEVTPGQIVWLPIYEEIRQDSIVHQWDTHRETYGHPALVVRVHSKTTVEIRTISSLNNTPLREKGAAYQTEEQLKAHLLIQHPSNTRGRWENPNGADNLHIRDGKCLAGPCYVRLDKKLLIEPDQLAEYDCTSTSDNRMELDEPSTHTVQHLAKLISAIYDDRATAFDSLSAGIANTLRLDDLAELASKQSQRVCKDGAGAEDKITADSKTLKRRSDSYILAPQIAILRPKRSLP